MKKISRNFFRTFLASLILLPLALSFNNCAGQQDTGAIAQVQSQSQFEAFPGLAEVNYFKSPLPSTMSGQVGYAYLLKEYFGPQCASCHGKNGVWQPNFADVNNVTASYFAARNNIPTPNMIRRITSTANCAPYCHLDERGQVFQAIQYWLEHRD